MKQQRQFESPQTNFSSDKTFLKHKVHFKNPLLVTLFGKNEKENKYYNKMCQFHVRRSAKLGSSHSPVMLRGVACLAEKLGLAWVSTMLGWYCAGYSGRLQAIFRNFCK